MKNNGHKSASLAVQLPKCSTGIQGLDEITSGGLPRVESLKVTDLVEDTLRMNDFARADKQIALRVVNHGAHIRISKGNL
jgi:hypothetical protein